MIVLMQKEVRPLSLTATNETRTPPESFLLRRPSREVYPETLATDDVKMVLHDMLNVAGATTNLAKDPTKRTMVGLHARQLGYDLNVVLVWWNFTEAGAKPSEEYQPKYRMFINPKIIDRSSEMNEEGGEGCFSIDKDIVGVVPRHNSVTFTGQEIDLDELQQSGNVVVTEVEEASPNPFVARVIQHEVDHGDGKRFPTCASELRQITDRNTYISSGRREGFRKLTEEDAAQIRIMASPMPCDEV